MLFNSFAFVVFLPIVFLIYWSLQKTNLRVQNLFILTASYVFYGWWDYRFLALIFISSLVDFLVGLRMARENRRIQRRLLLFLSLTTNLGILGFFKYYGFFVDSFISLLSRLGIHTDVWTLNVILPIGISFYTFQTLSYTIDLYRRKIEAAKNPIDFFTFVAFFPQLVAGPIERARNLLPQFKMRRQFDIEQAKDGLRQMLWGVFKKVVVADNISRHVNFVYSNYAELHWTALLIGSFLFTIQVYCDFSGYSDIAIGTARLFGFRLMRNFAFPHFARDIAEFWRRWHISLSTWFRDYVYIPLGGSRAGKFAHFRNLVITFVISGLWHGANWTFIIWGLLHGLYYLPLVIRGKLKRHEDIVAAGRLLPSFSEFIGMLTTFLLVQFALVLFRAESFSHAFGFFQQAFASQVVFDPASIRRYIIPLFYCICLLSIEWFQRSRQHGLEIASLPVLIRWIIYITLTTVILSLGNFGAVEFIYFQF